MKSLKAKLGRKVLFLGEAGIILTMSNFPNRHDIFLVGLFAQLWIENRISI